MSDEEQQSINTAFILSFYKGEDFDNNKDAIVPVPAGVYSFVTEACPESVEDMWLDLVHGDDLPELYDEMVEAVIDFDEKTWKTKFNNGDVKIAYGDNVLLVNIQPTDVHGVEVAKQPPHSHSFGLIKDMGLYNISVKFYIIDEESEADETEAFDSLDNDNEGDED